MKKIGLMLLVLLLVGICLIGSASAMGGTGTETDPWTISTPEDLQLLSGSGYASYTGTDKYFQIINDIDMSSVSNFTPIADSTTPFIGHFNGLNHTISNMTINVSTYAGLFYQCGSSCQISNIRLKDCTVSSSSNYVGGIAGYMYQGNGASVSFIETEGCKISSSSYHVGGIAGYGATSSSGSVTYEGCYVHDGNVTSSSFNVGGIAGNGANSSSTNAITYNNCVTEREVVLSSSSNSVGGIAGYGANSSSNVKYVGCKTLDSVVKASSYYVGGIAGDGASSSSTVTYDTCVADNVYMYSSSADVGGIAGYVYGTANCVNCSVTNCTIYGTQYVGGIVGRGRGTATITEPIIKNNNIQGGSKVGGAAGQ